MNLYQCTCGCGCDNKCDGYICDSCTAGVCRSKIQK